MSAVDALTLLKRRASLSKLSFGCPVIDNCIGFLPTQGITEISGEAGCGKTQFCLALSCQVQLDVTFGGLKGSTVFISCGEGSFPIRRLSQMASNYEKRYGIPTNQLLSRIYIKDCYNTDDAMDHLMKMPEMCRDNGVRLLIIDSLAGLVRFEYDNRSTKEMSARTSLLFKISAQLKWLADIHNVCVIVINQVTAEFNTNNFSNKAGVTPALGLAWSHCVNTRIMLERDTQDMRCAYPTEEENQEDTHNNVPKAAISHKSKRKIHLLRAAHRPASSCGFFYLSRWGFWDSHINKTGFYEWVLLFFWLHNRSESGCHHTEGME